MWTRKSTSREERRHCLTSFFSSPRPSPGATTSFGLMTLINYSAVLLVHKRASDGARIRTGFIWCGISSIHCTYDWDHPLPTPHSYPEFEYLRLLYFNFSTEAQKLFLTTPYYPPPKKANKRGAMIMRTMMNCAPMAVPPMPVWQLLLSAVCMQPQPLQPWKWSTPWLNADLQFGLVFFGRCTLLKEIKKDNRHSCLFRFSLFWPPKST